MASASSLRDTMPTKQSVCPISDYYYRPIYVLPRLFIFAYYFSYMNLLSIL